jgi:hypothetical protein
VTKPTVKYGTSNGTLDSCASSGVSITYDTAPNWANHVVLSGLEPNTQYFYMVDGGEVNSFKTARCAGDMTAYNVSVVVDMGTMGEIGLNDHLPKGIVGLHKNETNTMDRLIAQMTDYEFIAHPGDIAYADYAFKEQVTGFTNMSAGSMTTYYNAINEAFHDEMTALSKTKPYMIGVGNHEANCDNGGYKQYSEQWCPRGLTNFTQYKVHWNMPGDGSISNNFWYSFDYGMTHYLVFDTETDLAPPQKGATIQGGTENFDEANVGAYPNAQNDFIKNDLANVDRSKTPWVVAMGHRPWYVGSNGSGFQDGLANFEPLFVDGKVDLVMHGHVHLLSRSYPVWNNGTIQQTNYTNAQAPVYIVNGAAGHYDGLDAAKYPIPNYIPFVNDTMYSYSQLEFHNKTHLTHRFRASSDNHVIDEITLIKNR